MKTILYGIWQCTWGILQTLLGLVIFLRHIKCKHYTYHGAIVTEWPMRSSMSLGVFVFITTEPFFAKKYERQICVKELSKRLLVHEYGHTIQSAILGPLYLIIIGIPSTIWGFAFERKRKIEQIPYGLFFTERWANQLGERITSEKSIDMLVLD